MYEHLKRVSEHMRQNLMELKGEIIDQLDQLEYYIQQQQNIHSFSSIHEIHQDGLYSRP